MKRLSHLGICDLGKQDWTAYFEDNAKKRLQIHFTNEDMLTEKEKELIAPSIRMFQIGEASEGRHLLKTVKEYVSESGDQSYLEAMRLFIAEENRHSAYLREFMTHCDIPRRKRNDLDAVFRGLRKIGGLKGEVTVLLTAEIVALSYYSALSECTGSNALKQICARMLHDELRHIVFQSHTLYKLGISRRENVWRVLFLKGVLDVVWLRMKPLFLAGGFSYRKFKRECMGYLRQSVDIAESGRISSASMQ